jgi:UDP-N-acetyl-D-glucosamine dehydrogenase
VTVDVAVCGLGYVGLALARAASMCGLTVTGYDIAPDVVAGLNSGQSRVDDVFDEDVRLMAAKGFVATTDPDVLGRADVVTICVPTPLDEEGRPELGPVRRASAEVAARLRPGMLVVLESTSYPGTTEEVVLPILEAGSGLVAGTDFHLAFSPERIDPGNKVYTLAKTPKIVGGHTPACAAKAAEFYGRFVENVVRAKGTREAEMAKLLENTYRHINIGLANEIAMLCDRVGIDVWDVIACAGTKPFGFQAFFPGPGVGGHCIPVDPHYLAHKAREQGFVTRLIDLAEEVNAGMPRYVVQRSARLLRTRGRELAGARVLVLGVTYKADIADQRMSPAYAVVRELRARGAVVSYHDPYIAEWTVDQQPVTQADDLAAALRAADLSILLQEHRAYLPEVLTAEARLLFDTRGVLADRGDSGHVHVL